MSTRNPKYKAIPFYVKNKGKEKDDWEETLFSNYFPNVELKEIHFTLPMEVTEDSIKEYNKAFQPLFEIPKVSVKIEFPYIYISFHLDNYGIDRHIDLYCYYINYTGPRIRGLLAFYEHYYYGKELNGKEKEFLNEIRESMKRLGKRGRKKKSNEDNI